MLKINYFYIVLTVFLSLTIEANEVCAQNYSKKDITSLLELSLTPFKDIFEVMKNGQKYVYVVRVVDCNSNLTDITLTVTSAQMSSNIIESLNPFYYVETDFALIILPIKFEKNLVFKNYLEYADINFVNEKTTRNKYYAPYGSSYSAIAYPSVAFCNYKISSKRKEIIMKHYLCAPISSIPVRYRPITNYHTSGFLEIDTISIPEKWYSIFFNSNCRKIRTSNFKNRIIKHID